MKLRRALLRGALGVQVRMLKDLQEVWGGEGAPRRAPGSFCVRHCVCVAAAAACGGYGGARGHCD